jgi:hypothetical protein
MVRHALICGITGRSRDSLAGSPLDGGHGADGASGGIHRPIGCREAARRGAVDQYAR